MSEEKETRFGDIRDEEYIYGDGDQLLRATAYEGSVRVMGIDLTQAAREQAAALHLSPLAAGLSAELMMAAAFLGADLKNEDAKLSITCLGDRPEKKVSAFCDAQLRLRVALPAASFEQTETSSGAKLDFAKALGAGQLQVIKYLRAGHPYTGTVESKNGDPAEALVYYLALSEQRPAMMSFGVRFENAEIKKAVGLFAELLPFAPEEHISRLEKRVASFPDLSDLAGDFCCPELMDLLMGDPEIRYLARQKPSFYCPCSHDYFGEKLLTLGTEDLRELADDEKGIDLHCEFCGKDYHFEQEDLLRLLRETECAGDEKGPCENANSEAGKCDEASAKSRK